MWPNRVWPTQEHKKLKIEKYWKGYTQTRKHKDNTDSSKAIQRRQRTRLTPLTRTLQLNLQAEITSTWAQRWQSIHRTTNYGGKASAQSNMNPLDDCGKASTSPERRQTIRQWSETDDQVRPRRYRWNGAKAGAEAENSPRRVDDRHQQGFCKDRWTKRGVNWAFFSNF